MSWPVETEADDWAAMFAVRKRHRFARIMAWVGVGALLATAAIYVCSFADVVTPAGVFAVAFPIAGVNMFFFVSYGKKWRGKARMRWWMPVICLALVVNLLVIGSYASDATSGGTIRKSGNMTLLMVRPGRVIRALDAQGIREVQRWDLRVLSSGMMFFLALTSFGVFAYLPPANQPVSRSGR